ncbi:MAG TPA: Ig-like domain-containing protein [Gemmatimonadaceae bacterium]
MRSAPLVSGRMVALVFAGAVAAACGSDSSTQPKTVASVTVSPAKDTVQTGETAQFTAELKDANGNVLTGQSVTWTSSDTDAAPISASGAVAAILPGTSTITATAGGVSNTADLTILAGAAHQLSEGERIGDSTFAPGDGPNGGQGDPVGSVPCAADAGQPVEHRHSHLTLIANGQQIAIPLAIGVMNPIYNDTNEAFAGTCFYWLHTHDQTGIIHVEPFEGGHTFTLGDFFDIWGQPLTASGVAGYSGSVAAYVDGKRFTGDPRSIVLADHQQITLEVGAPLVAPPIYTWPNGY